MALLSMPNWLVLLSILFVQSIASSNDSFSAHNMLQNSRYRSRIVFHGDATASENASAVQLSKSGWIEYTEPISFAEGHGFSSYFEFSVSSGGGGTLTFLISPSGFNSNAYDTNNKAGPYESEKTIPMFVAIVFYLTKNAKHVAIDVGRFISLKSRNFLFAEGDLAGEKKLHSWIDYQASYKKIEVRLSESTITKPVGPLISFPIDLSDIWRNDSRFVSLGSYDGNSSQACIVYTWKLRKVAVPRLMHSEPFDPNPALNQEKPRINEKEKYCFLRLLVLLLLGFACGVAAALTVVYVRAMFGDRRAIVSVVPEECTLKHVEFRSDNVNNIVKLYGKQ